MLARCWRRATASPTSSPSAATSRTNVVVENKTAFVVEMAVDSAQLSHARSIAPDAAWKRISRVDTATIWLRYQSMPICRFVVSVNDDEEMELVDHNANGKNGVAWLWHRTAGGGARNVYCE